MLTEDQWYRTLLKLTQCGGAEGEEEPKEEEPPKDDDDDDDDDDPPKPDDQDTAGLKSALEKERKARKQLEKEARQLRKFKDEKESADLGESEKAKKKAADAETKVSKLADRLRTQAVDSAISKIAGRMKFRDVDDALAQVVRDTESWIEQDEDDPSEIEVDEGAVEKAVKALADKKPYLLDAEGEELPSGSKFNGKKKSGDEMSEEALRAKYPALRRSASTRT